MPVLDILTKVITQHMLLMVFHNENDVLMVGACLKKVEVILMVLFNRHIY